MGRFFKFTVLLSVIMLFAACNNPSVAPPEKVWSEEAVAATMQGIVEPIVIAMAEGSADALLNVPAGGPMAALELSVDSLQSPELFFEALMGSLETTHYNDCVFLPRGVWEYKKIGGKWEKIYAGDDSELVLKFPFGNIDGSTSQIVLTIDWMSQIFVKAPYACKEVPTHLAVYWTKDNIRAGRVDLKVDWHNTSCGVMYETRKITLDGYIGHHSSADYVKIDAEFKVEDAPNQHANYVATTTGTIWAKLAKYPGKKHQLSWDAKAYARTERGQDCFKGNLYLKNGHAELHFDGIIESQKTEIKLGFKFDNLVEYPHLAVDVHDGYVKVKEGHKNWEQAASFKGTLNDSNKDYLPGDNIIITFQDGKQKALDKFLKDNFDLGNIVLPINP